ESFDISLYFDHQLRVMGAGYDQARIESNRGLLRRLPLIQALHFLFHRRSEFTEVSNRSIVKRGQVFSPGLSMDFGYPRFRRYAILGFACVGDWISIVSICVTLNHAAAF